MTEKWPLIIQVITGIVTVASIIVKMTPNTKDDAFIAKLLNLLAINPKK